MKKVIIKKSKYFTSSSKIFLCLKNERILLSGFGLYTISLNEGDSFYVKQLWTRSKSISYDQVEDGSQLSVKPKLNRLLAFIIGVVFIICFIVYIYSKSRWSFTPLIPFIIYIITYLSFLRNEYLILKRSDGQY
jgi:hypothetical protein